MNKTDFHVSGSEIAWALITQYGYKFGPVYFIDLTSDNIIKVAEQINSPWMKDLRALGTVSSLECIDYIQSVVYEWNRTFELTNRLVKWESIFPEEYKNPDYKPTIYYSLSGEYQMLAALCQMLAPNHLPINEICWNDLSYSQLNAISELCGIPANLLPRHVTNYFTDVKFAASCNFKFPNDDKLDGKLFNGIEYYNLGYDSSGKKLLLRTLTDKEKIIFIGVASIMESIAQGILTDCTYPPITVYQRWKKGERFFREFNVKYSSYNQKPFPSEMKQKSSHGLELPDAVKKLLASGEEYWHRFCPIPQGIFLDENRNSDWHEVVDGRYLLFETVNKHDLKWWNHKYCN